MAAFILAFFKEIHGHKLNFQTFSRYPIVSLRGFFLLSIITKTLCASYSIIQRILPFFKNWTKYFLDQEIMQPFRHFFHTFNCCCFFLLKVLNILQSCALAFDKVDENNVYTCVGHPLKGDIRDIITWMLNEPFSVAYQNTLKLKTLKGLSLQDIITEVHLFIHQLDLPQNIRLHLLIKMAELEERLLKGTSEKIQLGAMISAFQVTRDMVKEEANK